MRRKNSKNEQKQMKIEWNCEEEEKKKKKKEKKKKKKKKNEKKRGWINGYPSRVRVGRGRILGH